MKKVKWAESAGARVVPIRYGSKPVELEAVFNGISGLLLPGGGASLDPRSSQYYKAAAHLLDLAEHANAHGQRFAVFGTCLGWELLAVWASGGNASVLEGGYDDGGRMHSLRLLPRVTPGASSQTMLANAALRRALLEADSTFYSHEFGVLPETVLRNPELKRAFNVLATAKDARAKEFVAMAQAWDGKPFYGVQFHPEKPLFEWTTKANISHADAPTTVGRALAAFFNDEVRKSRPASFAGGEREAFQRDIHAAKLTYLGDAYFSEVYVF